MNFKTTIFKLLGASCLLLGAFQSHGALINIVTGDLDNVCRVENSVTSATCQLNSEEDGSLLTYLRADIETGELGLFSEGVGSTIVSHVVLEETISLTLQDGFDSGSFKFQMQVFGDITFVGGLNAWANIQLDAGYFRGQDLFRFGDGSGTYIPFENGKILEIELFMDSSLPTITVDLHSDLYCVDGFGSNVCNLGNTAHLNIETTEGLTWVASDTSFLSRSTFGGQPIDVSEPSSYLFMLLVLVGLRMRKIFT